MGPASLARRLRWPWTRATRHLSPPVSTSTPVTAPPLPLPEAVPARLRQRRQAQQVLLGYLARHGSATPAELAALLPGRERRSTFNDLRELVEQGVVIRTGKGSRLR